MKRTVTLLSLALPLLFLGGCALFESKATRALRASPDYRAGYGDGCHSTNPTAGGYGDSRIRDEDAFQGNPAYRRGWNEGFGACRGVAQMQNYPGGIQRP